MCGKVLSPGAHPPTPPPPAQSNSNPSNPWTVDGAWEVRLSPLDLVLVLASLRFTYYVSSIDCFTFGCIWILAYKKH